MKKFINYQFSAVVVFILSIFTIFQIFLNNQGSPDVQVYEPLLNAILGIVGSVLLFQGKKLGLTICLVWAVLQIPIYYTGNENGISFAFSFNQAITSIYGNKEVTGLIDLGTIKSFKYYGVNFIGFVFLALLLLTNISSKKSKK